MVHPDAFAYAPNQRQNAFHLAQYFLITEIYLEACYLVPVSTTLYSFCRSGPGTLHNSRAKGQEMCSGSWNATLQRQTDITAMDV